MTEMRAPTPVPDAPTLDELLHAGRAVAAHRPWPRAVVDADTWILAAECLAQGGVTLLGLWGEAGAVHLGLLEEPTGAIGVLSLDCPDRRFPSVGELHAPAIRLERAIADLYGLEAAGSPDARPWLDHGRWGVRHPLGGAQRVTQAAPPYAFLPAEGDHLHRIPVGPVHAGIIEPGHFRFSASGETVVRLEARLGYVHKGIDGLMAGAPLARAAQLAGDIETMDGMLAEDFIGISMSGQLNTKSQQLDRIRNHQLMLSKIRLSDMKIKLLDTVAIVTCQAEVEGTSEGVSMRGTYRYTRVYQHLASGEWKITSFEATRIRPMKSARDKSGDASEPVSLGVVREPRFG